MPSSFLRKLRNTAQQEFNPPATAPSAPRAEDLALLDTSAWGQNRGAVQRLITQWPELVNHAGEGGLTPLHCAAAGADGTHVAWLIERGAKLDARDSYGNTPLHYAALAPYNEATDVLINAHAAVNAQNDKGETPLHYAVMHERSDSLRLLIAAGAKPDLPRHDSETPRSLAKKDDHGHPVGIPPGVVPANMQPPLDAAVEERRIAFDNVRVLQRDLDVPPGPSFIRKRHVPKNGQ